MEMEVINYDNSSVRRQDRLLERERAMEILRGGEYGFLALGGEGGYGVPVNYAMDGGRLYIHCAPEGEKLRRAEAESRATFCVVGRTEPRPAEFTTGYESVMLHGLLHIVEDDGERMRALSLIVDKYSAPYAETGMKYAAKSFSRTAVLRFDVTFATGKCKPLFSRRD